MSYLQALDWEVKHIPLKQPYVLSFATLKQFKAVLVRLQLGTNDVLLGEVVPLPGYAEETVASITDNLAQWKPTLLQKSCTEARQFLVDQSPRTPFASSLMLSALDTPWLSLSNPSEILVPLVYPTASSQPNIEQGIMNAIETGYRTIKIKVGQNLDQDLEMLTKLSTFSGDQIKFRFDANQGYTLDQATLFVNSIENQVYELTELVEQPLPSKDWQGISNLSSNTIVPLMLDESIYTINDVTQAAKVGCQWIKLKLCKQGGIHELVALARHAAKLGIKVTIGNGVATDISNLIELTIYQKFRALFSGACEANGFVKLEYPIQHKTLRIESGYAKK